MEKTYILSSSLQLKTMKDIDASPLFALTEKNRLYLKPWLPWVDACTKEKDSLAYIRKCNEDMKQNISLVFGIFHNSILIGVVGYNEINSQRRQGTLGYWISESHQNKGYVTLACQYLITLGFEALGLERIFISCAESNIKSRNIPLRLGFQKEKIVEEYLYDALTPHIIYFKEKNTL